ncbi:MAG: methyl-accepting chemotaxis protein [Deltaproteobacteria bacterium]|nr:methyl-accepting chemotaxis protein [Deltaproteobacteria bacterium]
MSNKKAFRRRNYFIKKKFQLDFSAKFLVIIVIEAVLAIGLFLYLSKGTLTTGYSGSELKVASTYNFFLPMLLFSNIIIVGVTAIAGIVVLVFLSHRIAGPLYRFENVLSEIGSGNLTYRFKLRETDQFVELENSINVLATAIDKNMGGVKYRVAEISRFLAEIKTAAAQNPNAPSNKELDRLLQETAKKLLELEEAVNYFKTSGRES